MGALVKIGQFKSKFGFFFTKNELFGYIQSFSRNFEAMRVFFANFYTYGQTF